MEEIKKVNVEIVDTKIVGNETKNVAMIETKEVKEFLKRNSIRIANTIPENVEIEIMFTSDEFKVGKYPARENGSTIEREGIFTKAILTYIPEASNMICGIEYPLSLPKNAIIGLANYNNANGGNHKLKDRTFKVFNKGRKTYMWTEVFTEEHAKEEAEQQI